MSGSTTIRLRAGTMRGKRVVIIASRFHPSLSRALVRGAMRVLRRAGVPQRRIRLLWAPGAFELPVLASRAAAALPRPDAIIALGALIRGETSQHEVLAHAVANGLSQLAVSERLPVTFGLIVAETLAQAKARAGVGLRPRHGRRRPSRQRPAVSVTNRGAEAAAAAVDVLRLFETLT
jgi:6,7-dimethyl-8-ribityllumazine synthase